MMEKKRLLILYDWFYPGFRAGGPIQSLTNLCITLMKDYEIHVVTGAADLNTTVNYPGISVDTWNTIHFPGTEGTIQVFYASKGKPGKGLFTALLNEVRPNIVYLNGIYSYRFFLVPLLAMKKIKDPFRLIICPRGMLKEGALQGKSFKKKVYLAYLRVSRMVSLAYWHATTEEEALEIKQHFARNQGVFVAANIPKKPWENAAAIHKKAGELRLVYLSLINEHKNLLLLLQLLLQYGNPSLTLDVYGPIVDNGYFDDCAAVMRQLGDRVQYKGVVEPHKVQEVLAKYHGVILLTKGENFGHALYEGLSVGRPVLTSNFTPWQNLYEQNAGVNLDINDMGDCMEKLKLFAEMDVQAYNRFSLGAHLVALNYYAAINPRETYSKLFGSG